MAVRLNTANFLCLKYMNASADALAKCSSNPWRFSEGYGSMMKEWYISSKDHFGENFSYYSKELLDSNIHEDIDKVIPAFVQSEREKMGSSNSCLINGTIIDCKDSIIKYSVTVFGMDHKKEHGGVDLSVYIVRVECFDHKRSYPFCTVVDYTIRDDGRVDMQCISSDGVNKEKDVCKEYRRVAMVCAVHTSSMVLVHVISAYMGLLDSSTIQQGKNVAENGMSVPFENFTGRGIGYIFPSSERMEKLIDKMNNKNNKKENKMAKVINVQSYKGIRYIGKTCSQMISNRAKFLGSDIKFKADIYELFGNEYAEQSVSNVIYISDEFAKDWKEYGNNVCEALKGRAADIEPGSAVVMYGNGTYFLSWRIVNVKGEDKIQFGVITLRDKDVNKKVIPMSIVVSDYSSDDNNVVRTSIVSSSESYIKSFAKTYRKGHMDDAFDALADVLSAICTTVCSLVVGIVKCYGISNDMVYGDYANKTGYDIKIPFMPDELKEMKNESKNENVDKNENGNQAESSDDVFAALDDDNMEFGNLNYVQSFADVDGISVPTYKTEINDCNILDVEVGTTGHKGGGTSHGCRTYFRIKDGASTDIRINPIYSKYKPDINGVEISFGGDTELDTFVKALKYGYDVLTDNTPSPMRRAKVVKYRTHWAFDCYEGFDSLYDKRYNDIKNVFVPYKESDGNYKVLYKEFGDEDIPEDGQPKFIGRASVMCNDNGVLGYATVYAVILVNGFTYFLSNNLKALQQFRYEK